MTATRARNKRELVFAVNAYFYHKAILVDRQIAGLAVEILKANNYRAFFLFKFKFGIPIDLQLG